MAATLLIIVTYSQSLRFGEEGFRVRVRARVLFCLYFTTVKTFHFLSILKCPQGSGCDFSSTRSPRGAGGSVFSSARTQEHDARSQTSP